MKFTYNLAVIAETATGVQNNAAAMQNDYEDVLNRTSALLGDFSGENAVSYAYHQSQFLEGYKHLIQTTHHFAQTVKMVLDSTQSRDLGLARGV